MCSRLEAPDVGEVQVLSDEKPSLSLSGMPYVSIRPPAMLLHIDGSHHRWFQDERWYAPEGY